MSTPSISRGANKEHNTVMLVIIILIQQENIGTIFYLYYLYTKQIYLEVLKDIHATTPII
jgi:hypothetical protein